MKENLGEQVTSETPVGWRLQTIKKRAVIQLMGSRVWGRFNPNHWDVDYAKSTGLSAPIQTGEMTSAYIAEMCVNHFGRHFFCGSRVACKYINATVADEVISVHGVISEKLIVEEGWRFVVDVWCENEVGDKKTVGTVEVTVPTVEKDEIQ